MVNHAINHKIGAKFWTLHSESFTLVLNMAPFLLWLASKLPLRFFSHETYCHSQTFHFKAGFWLQKLRFVNGKSGDFFAKAKKNY